MNKTCKTCGFANFGNICPIIKVPINPNQVACPHHQEELTECRMCGHVILKHSGTWSDELYIWVCDNCAPYLYTCATCRNRKEAPQCVMSQYHGDKQVLVKQQFKQGPFVMQSTQLNPEVLDEVCPTCTCQTPYNCQRNQKCDNWESVL